MKPIVKLTIGFIIGAALGHFSYQLYHKAVAVKFKPVKSPIVLHYA